MSDYIWAGDRAPYDEVLGRVDSAEIRALIDRYFPKSLRSYSFTHPGQLVQHIYWAKTPLPYGFWPAVQVWLLGGGDCPDVEGGSDE